MAKKLEDQVQYLTKQQKQMAARLEDQEGRMRTNNIRVEGPGEVPRVDLFLEDLIVNHLCPKQLSNFFSIEQAHGALPPQPRPRALPRTIIARVFKYRGRDAIFQAAGTHGDLTYENNIVRFFPDFTLQVQRQRQSFEEVKKIQRTKYIRYLMLFLARLRVVEKDKPWLFATPAKTWEWVV
ncbi:hypothetical protein NDU88_010713 [Pleurodeles waltl]|uniref:Uncharacterized protein n=1 Tax=Pleurodeles waltl TaxID=8319 RepID=A0AAV7PYV3_PLEWA|nr:hypothetical protein NDU88_010713 [Pleurodeles waltl]